MALIEGTSGHDRSDLGGIDLIGTATTDYIYGYDGDDAIEGRGGNDYLYGGSGRNTIRGGAGNDYVSTGSADGWFDGGTGNDIMDFSAVSTRGAFDLAAGAARFNATTVPGAGAFTMRNFENLYTGSGNDFIWGTDGTNEIRAGAGNDNVFGRGGADTLRGQAGDDYLDGGSGNDWLEGGDGDDFLYGDTGNDILLGGSGDDELYGGAGDDSLNGGLGEDIIDGLEGYDTMVLSGMSSGAIVDMTLGTARYTVNGQLEEDHFYRIEKVVGSYNNDVLMASHDHDLDGSTGNDTLGSGAGANMLHGGAGSDTASYVRSTAGVNVDLTTGHASGGWAQGDVLTAIENLQGSWHADTLRAGSVGGTLRGEGGNDTLYGVGGHDTLIGGRGYDRLWGGGGADDFVFTSVQDSPWSSKSDVIMDFQKGVDKIDLSAIDANVHVAGNQAFNSLIWSSQPYLNHQFNAGTIAYAKYQTKTYLYINVDNTNEASGNQMYDEIEMVIELSGNHTLTLDDFVL